MSLTRIRLWRTVARGGGSRGWLSREAAPELDWVAIPPHRSSRERLFGALRSHLPRRRATEALACPVCLRAVRARDRRCRCGEDLAPDDPVAALQRLGIEWPEASYDLPSTLPDGFGNADPERLRLAELAHELLRAREDAFAVLKCLADPQLTATVDRYPHQLATVRRVLGELRGRALLADEVGLGKTIEAALVLAELRARNLCPRALILAPPALLDQWQGELVQRFGLPVTRVSRPDQWADPPSIAVISIHAAKVGRHAAAIAGIEWDLVVIDEAHHLRNRKTRGHRFVRSLRCRNLLLLTATPLQSSLMDLHALVDLVKPGLLGTVQNFRYQFGVGDNQHSVTNPERLRSLLREAMIRNRRSTATIHLPPRRAAIHWIDLPSPERALYEAATAYLRDGPAPASRGST